MAIESISKSLLSILYAYFIELHQLKSCGTSPSKINKIRENIQSLVRNNNASATYYSYREEKLLEGLYIECAVFNQWDHDILFRLCYNNSYREKPKFGDIFDSKLRMEFRPAVSIQEKIGRSKFGVLEKEDFALSFAKRYSFISNRNKNHRISCKELERGKTGSIYINTKHLEESIIDDLASHFLLE